MTFRKKLYQRVEVLQRDLDPFLPTDSRERPHQGRWRYGKTPMQTFRDSVAAAKEKQIA